MSPNIEHFGFYNMFHGSQEFGEFPHRAKIGASKGGGMTFPKQVTLSTA